MNKDGVICFFNTAKVWGGGEKWHYETALLMHKNGHRVLVVTSPGSALQQRLPKEIACETIKTKNLSYLNFFKLKKVKNIFIKHNVDRVVTILSEDLKLASLAAKRVNVRRIIYSRGSAIPVKNHFINRYYFKNILTEILVNSRATKQTILQNNPNIIAEEKIEIIYHSVDVNEFVERKFSPVVAEKNDDIILSNLGRLVEQKNQKFLIDVAVLLKEKNIPFRLYIAGDGHLSEMLKNYAVEKSVQDKVLFTGFLSNVKDILMCSDIFVLPSLWEGFGYVLAEASLCRKPIVAFDISSNPELVLNNQTGFLTEPNNVNEFTDKIIELYRNPNLRKSFGDNGFEYIANNFSSEKIAAQLVKFLAE